MGDAYKSLTIKINASTAGFKQGLENIKSAVRATQRDMRALEKASKLDPSSLTLAKARIEGLQAESRAAASSLAQMNLKLSAAAKNAGGMERLKASMVGVSQKTGEARANLNMVNAELDQFRNELERAVAASKGITLKEARREVKSVKNDMVQLERLMREAFAGSTTLPLNATGIDDLVAKVRSLKGEFRELDAEVKSLKRLEELKNLAIDAEVARAQVKGLAMQSAKARSELRQIGASESLRKQSMEAKALAEAEREAANRADVLERALKMNTASLETAQMRMKALAQQAILLRNAIDLAEKRMRSVDAAKIAKIESEFTTTANAVRIFEERLSDANVKVATLESKLRTMVMSKEPAAEIEKVERELSQARLKAKLTGERLDHMNDAHSARQAAVEVERLKAELIGVQMRTRGVQRSFAQLGMSIRNAGYSMSATIGAGALMIGMYAIQSADEVDAAYRNMRKTVNGTEEQFASLKRAALEFSQTHFTSADQILEIESIGGQLGIQVQNLEKFSEVVSNTDIATNLDVETISQNFGQLSNIMNDMNQDIQEGPGSLESYSDALVRLGNNSAAQEDKIQNVMMRIASMGTISGFTTPELLALATATAATGQGAEAAGTAISKTFSGIESAINGAAKAQEQLKDKSKLSDDEIAKLEKQVEFAKAKMKAYGDVAGMSAKQFQKAWNNDPMKAFKAFIEGLQRIDKEGGSVDSTLKELGITSVRQKQTLMGLTQTTDVLNNSLQMANDAWNGVSDAWGDAGDAAREAQRKSEGFSGQLQILKNNGQVLAEEFTDSLTPVVSWLGDLARGASEVFGNLPPEVRNTASALGVLVAASGPLGIFTGSVMSSGSALLKFVQQAKKVDYLVEGASGAVSVLSGTFTKAERAALEAKDGVTQLGGAVSRLSGLKVLGVIGGIAAIGTAAAIAWNEYQKGEEWTRKVETAHKSLSDIFRESMINGNKGAVSARKAAKTYAECVDDYKKGVEDAAQTNEELASKASETFENTALVTKYTDTITRLLKNQADGTKLSADEFAELSAACAGYTQITGDTISCIQKTNGNVRVLKDGVALTAKSFRDLADAQIAAAKAEMLAEAIKEKSKENAEKDKQRAEWRRTLAELEKEKRSIESNWDPRGKTNDEKDAHRWQVANKQKEIDDLTAKINENTDAINKNNASIDAASEMYALLSNASNLAKGSLEKFIVKNDDISNAFINSGVSVNEFIEHMRHAGLKGSDLENFPQVIWDIADAMKNGANFTDAFSSAVRRSNGDLTKEQKKLLELKELKIGDKTYYVSDNGSIAKSSDGLKKFKKIKIDNKPYWVDDNGTVATETGKIENFKWRQIGVKHYKVYDDGTIRTEEGKLSRLAQFKIGKKTYTVDDKGTIRDSKNNVVKLKDELAGVKDKNIKIKNNCSQNVDAVNALKRAIAGLNDKEITITRNIKTKKKNNHNYDPWSGATYATGGYVPAKIIEHADGGFFVNEPTVIGRSRSTLHIAGEAGTEYVQKYAGGGMVLPLTNPNMRPWVNAVANQMSGMVRGGNNYYITLDYKAGDDANKMARDFMRVISTQLGR